MFRSGVSYGELDGLEINEIQPMMESFKVLYSSITIIRPLQATDFGFSRKAEFLNLKLFDVKFSKISVFSPSKQIFRR